MKVPFLDLTALHEPLADELASAYSVVLKGSTFVGSRTSRSFEEAFAAAHDAPAAAGCGSGTDALVLALVALGVGPGDEVIVPAMTFVATAEAVVLVGATPVLADVDVGSLLLTAESVEQVRSERTRAVIPVHLYGHVVPFDLLERWRDSGLFVVEDAAQAHLAQWEGRFVGSVGHAATFSFYPGKNLGALGDAGLVMSQDTLLVEEVAALRDHGRADKYVHDRVGYCSRMDGLQASFLELKLKYLESWTCRRRELADIYAQELESLVGWEEGAVHHLLVMRTGDREAKMAGLTERGIGMGVHYPVALSDQPALRSWTSPCPSAELAADEVLSLPIGPTLSDRQVLAVCEAVRNS